MIPVKLKLSNFTSYGESPPELDFTKFKLAAISGLNGAGKSSLLDSITWCLWGTSRAGDSADSLIHLGADNMQVEFSFELDNHVYTVKRHRSKKGGGSTNLEFWSGNPSTHSVRSGHNLTEGTIKATQQKIIDTLHLTFETFTNSAYLRQGHADEFTTKGPTDRKRILADILGLDHYDRLEEKAKEKSKEAQTQLTLLEYQLLEIEAEISQKEEREKSLNLAQEEAKKTADELKEVESLIKLVHAKHESINLQVKSLEEKRRQIETTRQELADILLKIELNKKAQKEFQTILDQKEIIESNHQKLQNLQEAKKGIDEKRSGLIKVKDELVDIQKVLNEREGKRKEAISKVKLQIKELQTKNISFQTQNGQLKNKKDICPTCKQPINEEQNKQLIAFNLKQIEENEKEIKTFEATVIKYEAAVLPETKLAQEKEEAIKNLEDETKEYFQIAEDIQKLETFVEKFTKLQQAITGVQTHQNALLDLQKIYKLREEQILKDEVEIEKLKVLEADLLQIKKELQAKEEIKQELSQKALHLSGKVGEAKQLVSRAEQLGKLNETKLLEKNKLTESKQIYDELSLAFGKKGIQAMIIENAIPEIEDETNRLLDKLTEGRMKISLQTQKETKTKVLLSEGEKGFGIIETLEIIISDEMGERPYELYSVAGDELVYIRRNGNTESIPIQELWSESAEIEHQGDYQLQKTEIEALCYVKGKCIWQRVNRILRHRSPQKIMEVKCGPGNYTVKLTKNHSVYILTPDGLKVKRTEDLQTGDYLLSPRVIPQDNQINHIDLTKFISSSFIKQRQNNNKSLKWNDYFIWSRNDQRINRCININSDWSKLMGICTAEGSGQKTYTISAGTNLEMAQEVLSLASLAFGTKERSIAFVSAEKMKLYAKHAPGISSISPQAQYRPLIGGRLVSHILKNMVGDKAPFKKIPSFIFNASKEVKLGFLEGLIDGDGHLSYYPHQSKAQVAITTISYRLASELVFLCRQLGIWARIENHGEAGFRRGMNHQKSYRIVISGKKNLEILGIGQIASKSDGVTKYEGIPYNLVGISRINGKRFKRNVEDQRFNCDIRRIPRSALDNYLKVQNLIQDWNILEVKEITEVEATTEYVYDLVVPGNNSFVAGNGAILVHNSGGETFRVNFAIRLAISKLLTHRAGARLQFLVIDEGFGTQDAPGRARLIEVLDAIKDDFEKIIVITHIEELKEEFPVRIEVSKNSGGSTFEVVGV